MTNWKTTSLLRPRLCLLQHEGERRWGEQASAERCEQEAFWEASSVGTVESNFGGLLGQSGQSGDREWTGWEAGQGCVRRAVSEKPYALPGSAASGVVSLADSKELDYIQLTVL